MIPDLFEAKQRDVVLGGFARPFEGPLIAALQRLVKVAPFRHMVNIWPPSDVGCVDQLRYRRVGQRSHRVPLRRLRSEERSALATAAGSLRRSRHAGGGEGRIRRFCAGRVSDQPVRAWRPFVTAPGQDEEAFEAPIVSVSLGLPAIFPFGGMHRADTTRRVPLTHGDVVVWGGAARLRYHGVLPLKGGQHPLVGGYRINLTFRKAL
jgi:alkylated DNA repair protein (DNA oxidative demethylase)